MTVPEHLYGLIITGIVMSLLVLTLLKIWIFNWVLNGIEVTYKKEME